MSSLNTLHGQSTLEYAGTGACTYTWPYQQPYYYPSTTYIYSDRPSAHYLFQIRKVENGLVLLYETKEYVFNDIEHLFKFISDKSKDQK